MLHFNTRVRRSTNDLVGGSIVSLVFLAFLHAYMPSSCGMLVFKDTTSSKASHVSSDMSLGDSSMRKSVISWTYDGNLEPNGVGQQLGMQGCQVCEFWGGGDRIVLLWDLRL